MAVGVEKRGQSYSGVKGVGDRMDERLAEERISIQRKLKLDPTIYQT